MPFFRNTKTVLGFKRGFEPSNLRGLFAWHKSDIGVKNASGQCAENFDRVATWEDQSGNGNDLAQAVDGSRPRLSPPDSDFNSFRYLHFELGFLFLESLSVTSPYEFYAAWQFPNNSTIQNKNLVELAFNETSILGNPDTPSLLGARQGLTFETYSARTDNTEVHNIVFDGTASQAFVNGVDQNLGDLTTQDLDRISYGAISSGGNPGEIFFAEAIIYDRVLNSGERNQVTNYLIDRYGI